LRRLEEPAASAGNNDDGYGRGQIASDDECEDSPAERKPNEITRKPVCALLDRGARAFSFLNRVEDAAKRRVAPDARDPDL
jgi:hypothetical protein